MKTNKSLNEPIAQSIDLFKVVVASPGSLVLSNARDGFITDFTPTQEQLKALQNRFKAIPVVTLFSVKEREYASLDELLTKQILHYIEVYGLGAPGLFNLEVEQGKILTMAFVKAVSMSELSELVQKLLYSNRPVADIAPVVDLIGYYDIKYDINEVRNNELKIALFDVTSDVFKSGDDAARYICYTATKSPLLIKSEQVIKAIGSKPVSDRFLAAHIEPLAKVFNRHKRIIMACKSIATRSTINKISKLSKTRHVPMVEPVAKRLVSGFLKGKIKASALSDVSIRDKFKYLNLIEWKLLGKDYDTFAIRNGKVWFEKNRTVSKPTGLSHLRDLVMDSLVEDLAGLKEKHILLDPWVDYGLPISRKQTLGNLPFGTTVSATKDGRFSAGIYWHNSFGDGSSIDLDLSAITDKGERTGWGGYSAYTSKDIVFSGDVTDARDGAIEFMTVNPNRPNKYGLMVNIFRGPEPCGAEIVVGYGDEKDWQSHTIVRERITLGSKQTLVGFLKNNTFVIYGGRLSSARISKGKHPVIDKSLGKLWTVGEVLWASGVKFDIVPQPGIVYDHDLRYESFSLDKLEALLGV